MKFILRVFALMNVLIIGSFNAFAGPIPVSDAVTGSTGPVILNSSLVNDPGPSRKTTSDIWGVLDYKKFNKYGTPSEVDYSDAPLPYSQTQNDKGQWQGLGISNGIDNGVQWSVAGSSFGTTADLIRGQEVTFKFLFWQANNGRHTYDQIFAAFDFGQDGKWDATDTILYDKIDTINDTRYADDTSTRRSRYLEFTLTVLVPETMTIGSTWLRTRVHCNHFEYGTITADNWINQGETEDYQLHIVGDPVPEPATLLLFGAGLAGLAGLNLRKKRTLPPA
jgi:hypothetical protein